MNLVQELLRPVTPFYADREPAYKRSSYPKDRNGKRFCPIHGWLRFSAFNKKDRDRLQRYCRECK